MKDIRERTGVMSAIVKKNKKTIQTNTDAAF